MTYIGKQSGLAAAMMLFVAVSGIGAAATSLAAEAPRKSAEMTRIRASEAPVVDGRLDDAIWNRVTAIDDLRQFQPNEDTPPSQRTIFYVAYDDNAIYVAARLLDTEPEKISASVLRQGERLALDDKISVIVDSFNDKRNGYMFDVNSNNVRDDALFLDTTQVQWDWDGIYQAKAVRDANGWSAEMAIPFKTLSFDPAATEWGLNLTRVISRPNQPMERIGWVFLNRNQNPSSSGVMTGIRDISIGRGLDVVPGLSLRSDRDYASGSSEFKVEPSLDVYYKLTPGLNAAITVNTDFSATEVDDRQVNLSRFSLFFPEKRSFFLRDSDIFEFGRLKGADPPGNVVRTFDRGGLENGRPFFSRSIGLSAAGQPVDLIGGAKLSGRIGGFSVGALAIRQDEAGLIDQQTLLVGRAVANVLAESSLGLIVTSGNPRSNLDNTLAGADFRYQNTRLPGGRSLEGEVWYQQSQTEGISGDDRAYGVRLRSPNNTGWRGGIGVKQLGESFNPAMGFINRSGVRDSTAEIGFTRRFRSGFVQSLYHGLDLEQYDRIDSGSGLQSRLSAFRVAELMTRTGDQWKMRYYVSDEELISPFVISKGVVLPVGSYSFDEIELEWQPAGTRPVSGSVNIRGGHFYSGDRWKMATKVLWKPSPHFWFTGNLEYNDVSLPQGDFIVKLMTTRFDVMFDANWSWITLAQYDTVSDSVAIHSRLRWIPEAGREMFLVFNHNLIDENADGTFRSVHADAALKLNYTFRF